MQEQTELNHIRWSCEQGSMRYRMQKRIVVGAMLILLGTFFLLQQMGITAQYSLTNFWPLLFIIVGLFNIVFSNNNRRRIHGAFQILIGFWVFACLEHLWGWTFQVTWPIVLIAFGVCKIISTLLANKQSDRGSAS